MSVLREIGIIARAMDSIANIEFRDIELARGQYLYLVRIAENPFCQEARSQGLGAAEGSQGQQEEQGMVCDGKRGKTLSFYPS